MGNVGGVTLRAGKLCDPAGTSRTMQLVPKASILYLHQLLCREFCALRVCRPVDAADEKGPSTYPDISDVTCIRTASNAYYLIDWVCASAAHSSL